MCYITLFRVDILLLGLTQTVCLHTHTHSIPCLTWSANQEGQRLRSDLGCKRERERERERERGREREKERERRAGERGGAGAGLVSEKLAGLFDTGFGDLESLYS